MILADRRAAADDDRPVLVLQDDVRLCRDFTQRATRLIAGIFDPAKVTLHLYLTAERSPLRATCGTGLRRGRSGTSRAPGGSTWAPSSPTPRLFEALGWRLDPVPVTRWRTNGTAPPSVDSFGRGGQAA